MWSVATILTGLYSFMIESNPTLGSIETSTSKKRQYAATSLEFNCRDKTFCKLFPEYVERWEEEKAARAQNQTSTSSAAQVGLRAEGDLPLAATFAGLVALLSIIVVFFRFLY